MKLNDILKTKLQESDWQEEHRRLALQEMNDWCKEMGIRNYHIRKEGDKNIIDVLSPVRIEVDALPLDDDDYAYLPYPFGEVSHFTLKPSKISKMKSLENAPTNVDGSFVAAYLGLQDLKGCPPMVSDVCDLSGNALTSWAGAPAYCGELKVIKNKITSFTGISREVLNLSTLTVDDKINRGILELLDLEHLEELSIFDFGNLPKDKSDELIKVSRIVNSCLNGSRDVFDLQSDLIDAGLEDWTKK